MVNTNNKQRFNFKKCVSWLIVFTFVFGLLGVGNTQITVSANDTDSKILELEQKIQELEQEQQEAQDQIKSYEGQIEAEEEKQAALAKEREAAEKQVALFQEKVDIIKDEINKTEQYIDDKTKEINDNTQLFLQRMRAMYMASTSSSPLAVLLGATDLSDFLTKSEVLERVSEHDTQLIEDLKNQKIELEELISELDVQKKDLNQTKKEYEEKSAILQAKYDESEQSKAELEELQKEYIDNKKEFADEIKEAEALIDERLEEIRQQQILDQLNQNIPDNLPEGEFAWPVPGYARISSGFGWRVIFGYSEHHNGIDIPAATGTPVTAAHDGVVVLSGYHYSYGNYLIIDHGGGIMTLYAHNDSLLVSTGMSVVRGQQISRVGNTGNSYGSHLHFEVRVENSKVDPLMYVSQPF